ncbi:centrosomal protein of 192 kDa isoform X2 [Heptranchias perlo]|uniref:centrosomal protein of 192 kDa isoform X2 n=1 Tax=Heptranchias perlo TaxID=212740 RepID=UPI003559F831
MMESVRNLEDETFPSFLLQSVRSNSSGMLENVTVSSNFGLPVAASTVAKNKSDSGNRIPDSQTSYLEEGRFSIADTHPPNVSNFETCKKFALSFKDELENVDDFIDAHCISDIMKKHLDEFSSSSSEVNPQHRLSGQYNNRQDGEFGLLPIENLDEISSGSDSLTDHTNNKRNKVDSTREPENSPATELTDEDLGTRLYSDSLASLLEDEKLLSLASLEDQSTDDEFDAEAFRDDRLEAYFKQLVPPGMQRGHIEGQELPEVHAVLQVSSNTSASGLQGINEHELDSSSGKLDKGPLQPLDYDEDNFQMPPVRQAATGMDSAPSSDEDTEDELEAVQQQSALQGQLLLCSATRHLLGESNRLSFRPGLEGGSSDESIGPLDELNDIGFEFRRSAEGQVISSPVVGDGGGGGDGSSGNEEDGNDGVSTIPSNSTIYDDRWGSEIVDRNIAGEEDDNDSMATIPSNTTTYDNLRGLRIVDRNIAGQDQAYSALPLQGNREFIPGQNETEGRLGPVGNGKVITTVPGTALQLSSKRSSAHRQEALDAMDTSGNDEMELDSVYFRSVGGNTTTDDQLLSTVQGTPFRLSQITYSPGGDNDLGLRDGPCGYTAVGQTSVTGNVDNVDQISNAGSGPPLAAAYLSPVYPDESAFEIWQDSSKDWQFHEQQKAEWSTGCSQWDNGEGETPSVVYQNEEGRWVTDLAYYYSLDKEQDRFNLPADLADSIQGEEFITGNKAAALIEEDQEEFEEEHKFIQEDKMDVVYTDGSLGNGSWKLPSNSCLILRASQAASDFAQGNQSYLRLSLGEFFGQRSEALGCLGEEYSGIKRPSFGYSITSPEQRAPVALFQPTDLSHVQDETRQLSNDDTLYPEDLERTDQETPTEFTTTFLIDKQTENDTFRTNKEPGSNIHMNDFTESENTKLLSPHLKAKEPILFNGTDSVLSISTIASAIADASVSADPAQLAAMILELSNKNRKKNEPTATSRKPNVQLKDRKSNVISDLGVFVEKNLEKSETGDYESEVLKSEFKPLPESISAHSLESNDSSECSKNPLSTSNSFSGESTLSATSKQESKITLNSKEELRQFNANETGSVTHSDETCMSVKLVEGKVRLHCQNGHVSETCVLETSKSPGPKHGDSKLMVKEGSFDNRVISSGDKANEMPNLNGTTTAVEKQDKCLSESSAQKVCLVENESSLDKTRCKTQTESGKEMTHKAIEERSLETSSCHRSSDRMFRAEQKKLTLVSSQPSAVHGVATSNSSLHCPKIQMVGPVEQRCRKSTSETLYEDDKEMHVTSKPQLGRDERQNSDLHSQEKRVSFEQSNRAPAAPKNSETDHSPTEEDQLNLRPSTSPLTHSSPSQVTELQTTASKSSSLTYSSPNLSRLSYISGIDATLQNSTAIGSPVNVKNDKTIELSTTIIRSSPTPTPDHTIVNPSESELAFPSSLEECTDVSFNPSSQPRHSGRDKQQSHECRSPVGKDDDGCSSHSANKLSSPQSGKAKMLRSSMQQLDAFPSAISGKPIVYKESSALQKNDHVSAPWQDKMNRMHCVESLNVTSTTNNRLGVFPALNTDDKYMPISSFKPNGASSDAPSGPTLLTGHSLLTTPLAQQYLGTLTSTNCLNMPLTSCYLSNALSSNMYSLAAGLPGANMLMGNIQAFGTHLDHNLGTRMLDPAQFYSTHARPLDSNFKTQSVSYQPSRTDMFDQWSGGLRLRDVGHVLVPEELRFPNSCCVGIASQTSLSMFNPTERWMQVSIGVVSVALNGEKMDTFAHQCWIFKNKSIIGPHVTEDLQLMFLPRHSGIFQCVLCVSSCPVSADTNTITRAGALAARVIITAVAEDPLIEVETEKSECLDFGDLVSGGGKAHSLKLINRTHATVPIRLVISANATAWRCFTFSKSDMSTETALQAERISPLVAPSVMNHVMQASYDGEDSESFIVWVHFRAPQKYINSTDPLGPAEEYFARVDIEVDSPGPSNVINSIPLRARVGIARIHAPKDMQTLVMSAKPGKTAKQILPLKNAGNIIAQLKVQTAESRCFLAKPDNLYIQPGEELEVVVSFTPQDTQSEIQSHLTILVQPFGPQYEVALKGLLGRPESVQSISSSSDSSVDIPPILSNKQFMSWGGVSLGRAVQQKLVLRNNSSTVTQQLRLLIKGQDQDCFQLQSTFGPEERLSSNRELMICPKDDVCVHLLFAPTRVTCMLARLEIKQSGIRLTRPGVKFTIPLSGYGGTSNIILEDVKKISGSYVVNLNDITADKVSQITFCMRNTGSRAAYVKAACFTDSQIKTFMNTNVINVSPAQFVLKERTRETITVTCHSTQREYLHCKMDSAWLCVICFFCGDEVSRQQLRRALARNRRGLQQMVCGDSPLQKIDFTQKFPGEELVSEVYDLPKRPNDIQIFYGNLNKVILSVAGSSALTETTDTEGLDSFSSSHGMNVGSESVLGSSERNASLDVLPVRGPQGSPLFLHVSNQVQNQSLKPKSSWTVKPGHLILTVPSTDGSTQTGRVQIINHSTRSLSFELSWPAHSLTVTPQHGVVDPESHLLILVSPNPSLTTKPSAVPWSGQIYVHCDNIQQLIKVQIQEDVIMDTSAAVLSPTTVLDVEPWTPNLHLSKPPLKPPATKLQIKNRTVHFPSTSAGLSSESFLEIENDGEENVKWFLSSFAPPYVKWVDESGDVYRATYTAFRCSRVSGTLQAYSKEKLPIVFMPRDKGAYSQFWDLECRVAAEPHMKHKIQFQLRGEGTKTKVSSKETDSASELVKTEATVKTRKAVSERVTKTGQEQPAYRGVFAPEDLYSFPATHPGESSTLKVNLRNSSSVAHACSTLHQSTCPVQTRVRGQIRGTPRGTNRYMWKSPYSTYW